MKNWFALAVASVMLMSATCASAQAEDYPGGKPVRIVVPSAPGSGGDSAARFFGEQLGKQLGGSFVIDNRTGAGGVIAAGGTGFCFLVNAVSYVGTIVAVSSMRADELQQVGIGIGHDIGRLGQWQKQGPFKKPAAFKFKQRHHCGSTNTQQGYACANQQSQ